MELLEPSKVTPQTKTRSLFEHTTCGRCGGSGFLSAFGHVHNGVCFGCSGAGIKLTKRGAEARRYFEALASCELRFLQPGDRWLSSWGWQTVERIGDNRVERRTGHILRAGDERDESILANYREEGAVIVEDPHSRDPAWIVYSGTNVYADGHALVGARSSSLVRLAEPETLLARKRAAAEYQLALTRSGRPRRGCRFAREAVAA